MTDKELLLEIHRALDGVEWTPATLEVIALLLHSNGYPIRDSNLDYRW